MSTLEQGRLPGFVSKAAITYALAMEIPYEASSLRQAPAASRNLSLLSTARSSRRLFPGTTEEGLLVRACGRLGPRICPDPCALLDQICLEPEGFDPWTACVCDRAGPRVFAASGGLKEAGCPKDDGNPMCAMDSLGRHLGVFCMSPTPQLEGYAGVGKESCFVLPSAKCSSGVEPPACGTSGEACMSTGPCSIPDSRSQLFLTAQRMAERFVVATGVFGGLVMLVTLCTCWLCAELHTGRSIGLHARSLAQSDRASFPEMDDDEMLPLQTDDE